MARAILLMISNNNLSLREIYTVVLNNDLPQWRTSFMTALPDRETEIMAGYQIIIYELGQADDPQRIEAVRSLGARLREKTNAVIYTHLEGAVSDDTVAELAGHGVHASIGPVSWQVLSAALTGIAATFSEPAPARSTEANSSHQAKGLFGRLGSVLRRGGTREPEAKTPSRPTGDDAP